MKIELIEELFHRLEQSRYLIDNVECWSARDLMEIFGYAEWRNFSKVVDKAKKACENSGAEITDHFVDINNKVNACRQLIRHGTTS